MSLVPSDVRLIWNNAISKIFQPENFFWEFAETYRIALKSLLPRPHHANEQPSEASPLLSTAVCRLFPEAPRNFCQGNVLPQHKVKGLGYRVLHRLTASIIHFYLFVQPTVKSQSLCQFSNDSLKVFKFSCENSSCYPPDCLVG